MKICINVGHTLSGAGSGAIGIKNESIENRKVANEMVDILKNLNHEVILSKIDYSKTTSEYLKKSVDIANRNKNKYDLFASIHFNAYNTKAQGVETYYYKGNNTTKLLASRISNEISKLGFKNRGAKDGSHLYVVRNTLMDAILIECCFIDNSEDMKNYDYKTMAKAICSGILGESSDLEISKDKFYRVCVGSFKDYDNAKSCLSQAKKNGYKDAFIY